MAEATRNDPVDDVPEDEAEDEAEEEGDEATMSKDRSVGGFVSGLLLGAAIGVAVALLVAPASGQVTRKRLHRKVDHLRDRAEGEIDDIKREARKKIAELRR